MVVDGCVVWVGVATATGGALVCVNICARVCVGVAHSFFLSCLTRTLLLQFPCLSFFVRVQAELGFGVPPLAGLRCAGATRSGSNRCSAADLVSYQPYCLLSFPLFPFACAICPYQPQIGGRASPCRCTHTCVTSRHVTSRHVTSPVHTPPPSHCHTHPRAWCFHTHLTATPTAGQYLTPHCHVAVVRTFT
jgi:hypothetical protein